MVTGKERVQAARERRAEYAEYRGILSGIAKNTEAADADRLQAIGLLMTLDREGVPPVYKY